MNFLENTQFESVIYDVDNSFIEAKDDQEIQNQELGKFLNDLLLSFPSQFEACQICRRKTSGLEDHHISGRKHSDLIIRICKDCHFELSMKQNFYDSRWRIETVDGRIKEAFLIQGICDILEVKAKFAKPIEIRISDKLSWSVRKRLA